MRWPAVGLRSRLQVNTVEHRSNFGDYGIELLLVGSGLLHQHIKLCLDPPMVACKHYKVPSSKGNYFNSNSDQEVLTFQLPGQFVCSPRLLRLLLSELLDGLA